MDLDSDGGKQNGEKSLQDALSGDGGDRSSEGFSFTLSGSDGDDLDEKGLTPIVENTMFKPPNTEHGAEETVAVDCGMSTLTIKDYSKLPPLMAPRYREIRQQTNVGISLVLFLSLTFIGLTHGIALEAIGGIEKNSSTWWAFLGLIYTMIVLALCFLTGLLWSDPGIVRRSEKNSLPVPLTCEEWVRSHLEGNANGVEPPPKRYIGSSDPTKVGDTYCVRCLVWRRLESSKFYFHCNICQRCIMHYDHHCSIFGRCIGGTSFHGNYKYFIGIICLGALGYLTCIISLLWSISLRYKPQIAVPVCFFILLATTWVLVGKLCASLFIHIRTIGLRCSRLLGFVTQN